jgi:multidrug efflux pump subunit AcrB
VTTTDGIGASGSDAVSRDDIEAKFREIKGEVADTAESAKGTLMAVGAAVAVVVVIGIFLFGKRRGKKKTTIVEVRRL